jgi:hypothetical protein
MGARPPQGDSSPPDTIEFGIAAVNARLDQANLAFPATRDDILRAVDDTAIPCDASGNTLDLSQALDELPQERFDTETELLNQLHPVFEEHRTAAPTNVMGRLRGMLPF